MNSDTPQTTMENAAGRQNSYTTYKWHLDDWSFCNEKYILGVTSPELLINDTEGLKCTLKFQNINKGRKGVNSTSALEIEFHQPMEHLFLQAKVSIINEEGEKLFTTKSPMQTQPETSLILHFQSIFINSQSMFRHQLKNRLVLLLELTILNKLKPTLVFLEKFNANFVAGCSTNFRRILGFEDSYDVAFNVQGREFRAEKALLARASEYFNECFSTTEAKGFVNMEIHHVDPAVFREFLRFIYFDEVFEIEKYINDLILLADKYRAAGLRHLCENYVSTHPGSMANAWRMKAESYRNHPVAF